MYDVVSYGKVKKACFLHNDLENPLIKKATLTDSLSCQIYPYLGFKTFTKIFAPNLEIQFQIAITRISIDPLYLSYIEFKD